MRYLALFASATLWLSACNTPQPIDDGGIVAPSTTTEPSITVTPSVTIDPAAFQLPNDYASYAAASILVPKAINSKVQANTLYTGALDFSDAKVYQTNQLGAAEYELILTDGLYVNVGGDRGLFYAEQTFNQILARYNSAIPKLVVQDQPTYQWRGSMIDVARHFRSIDYLKKHIVRMSAFKMNVLHLHLSDDQGWRVEIKKWPKLTTIGGSTAVDGDEGGFYTQAEIADLVAFAAQYHVDIVPEIDMPGHIQSALASYPELACEGESTDLYEGIEVGFSYLCLQKSELITQFVTDVLTEVAAIFPSQYIHIGGDEVLEISTADYSVFIEELNQIVSSLDKTLIGWEEIESANLTPDSIIQYWKPSFTTSESQAYVLSPCLHTYFDHGNYNGQPNTYRWCNRQGIPLEQVYKLDPADYPGAIGIEAPMWGERVVTDADADNRMWPRLAAIAELSWSGQGDFEDFKTRLSPLVTILDDLNVDYYPAPELNW